MKLNKIKLFSIALLTAVSASAQKTVTFKSLLENLTDREALTRSPEVKFTMKAATSYDRSSKVNNPADGLFKKGQAKVGHGWFANGDGGGIIRVENINGRKEKVIMDVKGPGAIVRWWTTYYKKGTVRIYLDGAKKPVIKMRNKKMIGGTGLVGYPFSLMTSLDEPNITWRGCDLYLPIPFQKSCKVTFTNNSFYQIWYQKYKRGTKVKTFSLDQLKENEGLINKLGEKLVCGNRHVAGVENVLENKVLAPEKSLAIELKDGAKAINKLSVQLEAEDYKQALRSTVVVMTFDGKQTAWLPLGSLVGVGYSDEKNDTYYAFADNKSKTLTSFYEMPYQKNAEIKLINYGTQQVKIKKFEVFTKDYNWDNRSLYFHATWFEKRNISTKYRWDMNYVTVLGKGQYVGTSITVFNTCTLKNNTTWWGEGDEKVYVDGETFPSIFGTGTEDYFGYAYCRPQRFWTPFISQPRGEGNKKWGYTNDNRYHFNDIIPFEKSIRFDMEVYHPFGKAMNYAVATFYYADAGSFNNIDPNIRSVRNKVAIHRDDVLDK